MKEKKLVKRKKLKIHRLFFLLIILGLIYYLANYYLELRICNIFVEGNNILSDQEILRQAKIDDYPSFYWTSTNSIKRRLLANPYIKSVRVKKEFFHVVTIEVKEYQPLAIKTDGNIILENETILLPSQTPVGLPLLLNYVPDVKFTSFIHQLAKVKKEILVKVSEIEYCPNDFDKDRFLFTMDDGNLVYLTITKLERLNYYLQIYSALEGKTGTLYLDSGNHFVPF